MRAKNYCYLFKKEVRTLTYFFEKWGQTLFLLFEKDLYCYSSETKKLQPDTLQMLSPSFALGRKYERTRSYRLVATLLLLFFFFLLAARTSTRRHSHQLNCQQDNVTLTIECHHLNFVPCWPTSPYQLLRDAFHYPTLTSQRHADFLWPLLLIASLRLLNISVVPCKSLLHSCISEIRMKSGSLSGNEWIGILSCWDGNVLEVTRCKRRALLSAIC